MSMFSDTVCITVDIVFLFSLFCIRQIFSYGCADEVVRNHVLPFLAKHAAVKWRRVDLTAFFFFFIISVLKLNRNNMFRALRARV